MLAMDSPAAYSQLVELAVDLIVEYAVQLQGVQGAAPSRDAIRLELLPEGGEGEG